MRNYYTELLALILFNFTLFNIAHLSADNTPVTFTLMLDPAGDASQPGRIIDDSFERGITLQFAQELKKELEAKNKDKNNIRSGFIPNLRVVLTRFPGETVEALQNASFANRLQVDLYVSLHFYQAKPNKSNIYLYYYLNDGVTDFWSKPEKNRLQFVPVNQVYKLSLEESKNKAETTRDNLRASKILDSDSIICIGCPFKPLTGIMAPSFAIEIGIENKNNFLDYIKPVADALYKIVAVNKT